ncbi:PTS glucitol/sorbitol transporter subunit IIA [Intestinirhabdus alba]|jgi:PTS system glucitol/sorbitol-specific IIA component|uniref:PTS fructose transporter subunit IIA n=1 Tax=Intestinirhabdus alba TaxID=2899544 RepID=A0A6L6II25_9ENTR|nr:PTS glucitol/sorbitol transporter subunit IIA [Intestinirhabdus alba]MTH46522.1 PTS fructose transporter subunit IIA [Intestinirhabdus alba]
MAESLYHLEIISVGRFVARALQQQRLILFADPVPAAIADYCAVHRPGKLSGALLPGLHIKINESVRQITAVGSVATANLQRLGHITLSFNGAAEAELPGTVHLSGPTPATILPGDRITICRR